MILNLTSDKSIRVGLSAPTMGYQLKSIILEGPDVYQLLKLNDEELRTRLSVLYTRFVPWSSSDAKN